MSAFDEIAERMLRQDKNFLLNKKKDLISPRGTLLNGKLPEYMDVMRRARNIAQSRYLFEDEEVIEDDATTTQLGRLFMRKNGSNTMDYGFVFSKDGTEHIIKDIGVGKGTIRIFEDYSDKFLFINDEKAQLWDKANNKKSLIARDIETMMRKTDIQYRTHGDRLQYLVIGKVVIELRNNYKVDRMVFPLFLFSCEGERRAISKTLSIDVDQTGFLNFSLDENLLDSEISKIIGGTEITIDSSFTMKLTEIQKQIPTKQYLNVESIEIDPTYSMIGIITGFETEYLDKAWEKILK